MSNRHIVLFSLLLLSSADSFGSIQIASFNTLTNDRFSDDSSFVAAAFDLSGIALLDTTQSTFPADDGGRWITMLSRNVFITAQHFHPNNGSTAVFYQSDDPMGASATRSVLSSQRIGSSDVRIGVLDSPLPASYATYNFATEDITALLGPGDTLQDSPYGLANAYVFGRSETDWQVDQDIAVGRNRIDRFIDGITAAGTTDDAIGASVDGELDPNFVTYEAGLEIGDSGGPLFVEEVPGELTIIGTNWFTASDAGGDFLATTYLGNYDDEIQAFIDANPVPEPKTFALLLGILSGLLSINRRNTTKKIYQ